MKLSEMRQLLGERDIRLTKSLGQNFLHDGNQLRRIVAAGELTPQDKVLEIGPGLGPLTELLLRKAGQVFAIETDARLVQVLSERFHAGQASRLSADDADLPEHGGAVGTPALQLLHADALEYLQSTSRDWSGWKLVSNLPYAVASPILVELALAERGPERMVATVQLEVAERITAAPGTADYGQLMLFLQLNYTVRSTFKIPAGCFFPPPDVDSACVTLIRRPEPLLTPAHAQVFVRVVKRSFSQRRKMMFKLLREDWPEAALTGAFGKAGLSPQTRAEAVDLMSFVTLARELAAV
jgi:16S rRNA (adenine1518-N6/adenine1519-N6)-dimethyltransferase